MLVISMPFLVSRHGSISCLQVPNREMIVILSNYWTPLSPIYDKETMDDYPISRSCHGSGYGALHVVLRSPEQIGLVRYSIVTITIALMVPSHGRIRLPASCETVHAALPKLSNLPALFCTCLFAFPVHTFTQPPLPTLSP